MALYFIGDLQSCCTPFVNLLQKIDFNPSTDELILLGDMINRGPQTLETLDTIMQYDGAIRCLLGNHELHFLSVAYGHRRSLPRDTLRPILESPKKQFYMDWIREQKMALFTGNWLTVHAGLLPEWTLEDTLNYAQEVESILQSPDVSDFIRDVFGNDPNHWDDQLTDIDRLRVIVNGLTRIRCCTAQGHMDMAYKYGMDEAPEHLIPWFNMPNRKTKETQIAFGHWSTLEHMTPAPHVLALDTACLWGGKLTAARIFEQSFEIIQTSCAGVSITPSEKW